MFEKTKAFSGFSVDDLHRAKDFYGKTLGLKVTEKNGMLKLEVPGNQDIMVYPKEDHRPATFTILNFPVENIEVAVKKLEEKGIHLEHYRGTTLETDERGIYRNGGPAIAWFKDPAGNVLSVIEGH